MRKTDKRTIVYALMFYPGGGATRCLCSIYSTREKGEAAATKLRKKLTHKDEAYYVDAWHVDGAYTE